MEEHGIPDVLIGISVLHILMPLTFTTRSIVIRNQSRITKSMYEGCGELFLHMRRMIGDMQPKVFVIENVTDVQVQESLWRP